LTSLVFLAVVASAVMHAGWNIIVKLRLDRLSALFLIQGLMGFIGLAMVLTFPWPSLDCWPFVVASGFLHTGYNLFLARSYRTGDMGQVYPIARGTAPFLSFLGAYVATGELLSNLGILGLCLLIAGIWLIAMKGGRGAIKLDGWTLFFALCTSGFIGAYTITDGIGGRISQSPSSYAGFVFLLDAIFLTIVTVAIRGIAIFAVVRPYFLSGLAGAGMSAGAYWVVIWAMTLAPIGAVAALRETSTLFAVLMSAAFLGEPLTRWRISGAVLIVAGAALLRLA
jgi:drug/metabolite transporter (DMT)-like permease